MTVEQLITQANALKAAIRQVQNDNTGPEARNFRNALATAFENMTDVISQLNLAQEQDEALTECCQICDQRCSELLRMADDDDSAVYLCRSCYPKWLRKEV